VPSSPYRVLFVCLGNICRSPAGEGVLQHLLAEEGLHSEVSCDSAGTADWHTGKRADSRMRAAATARGIELASRARQVQRADFDEFDLILAMDRDNLAELESLRGNDTTRAELKLFCELCSEHEEKEVPDPYYGGEEGFELVLDILRDGCANLIAQRQ
jgi:protein-tyrosine phosphatase